MSIRDIHFHDGVTLDDIPAGMLHEARGICLDDGSVRYECCEQGWLITLSIRRTTPQGKCWTCSEDLRDGNGRLVVAATPKAAIARLEEAVAERVKEFEMELAA